MVNVSPSTRKFYLSREALIQLKVIPPDFPKVGSAVYASELSATAVASDIAPCGCPIRKLPPGLPDTLPFQPRPENIERMKAWLLHRYRYSTLNQCSHQLLQGITGPELSLHVDESVPHKPVHTPSVIPIHIQEPVHNGLKNDCKKGVLEKVPFGEPSQYCHRMVVTTKAEGKSRRTIDMS